MLYQITRDELFRYFVRQLAMDKHLDPDGWRTNENGQHYHIDNATGEIDAGMGGQFNGMSPEEVSGSQKTRKKPSPPSNEGLVSIPKEKFPEHIKNLHIPPAWTDVVVNPDPNGRLLAWGLDSKQRPQKKYSQWYTAQQKNKKIDRVQQLDARISSGALDQILNELKKGNQRQKDTADCISLIEQMGLRPGSERDTGAEKEALGATTLRGENVVTDYGQVFLKFVGKKGVNLNLKVPDTMSKMLLERKKKVGDNGQLFSCNERDLQDCMSKIGGKPKDLRTRLAMNKAKEKLAEMKPAETEKEFKKIQNKVGDYVSEFLGNTRAVALSSYIPPSVFDNWRHKDDEMTGKKVTGDEAVEKGRFSKKELARIKKEFDEYYSKPQRDFTDEELEEEDAESGYFHEYDDEGNRIDDW